jgi:hypothetical protein
MLSRIVIGLLLVVSAGAAVEAAEVRIDLAVNPRIQPFVDFLETPAYIPAILENSGYGVAASVRPKILKRGKAVRVKNATLSFVDRKGLRFNYAAEIEVNLGVSATRVSFPVSVDAAAVSKGRLLVVLSPPLAGALPEELVDRIQLRAQQMASPALQESVVSYLEGLAGSGFAGGVDTLFVQILSDSYNLEARNAPASGREPGDAEPLSDQIALIITLAIWLLLVPAGIFIWRYRSRRVRASS